MRIHIEGGTWSELELAGIDTGVHKCLRCKEPWRSLVTKNGKWNLSDPCVALCGIWRPVKRSLPRLRGRKFQIHTPTCIFGVRGTLFSLLVAPDGGTRVTVAEGQVVLRRRGRPESTLTAGQHGEVSAADEAFQPAAAEPAVLAELAAWGKSLEDEGDAEGDEDEDEGEEAEALVVGVGPGVTRIKVVGAEVAAEPLACLPWAVEATYRGVRLSATESVRRPGQAGAVRLELACGVENTTAQDAYVSPGDEVCLLLDTGERLPVDDYRLETCLPPLLRAEGSLEFVIPAGRSVTGLRFGKGETAAVVMFGPSGSPVGSVSHEGGGSDE